MIAAGRRKANPHLHFYRRSIERFTLPERAFDAAIFMSETFPVIVENANLLSHLKSVGRALKRGGLYCIDIDRQDPIARVPNRTMWRERTARAGGVALDIREFHRPIAWHSPLHSIYELECTINFPAGAVTTRDLIPVRYTTPATLELAALASGVFK
ncbi:MAG: class I SAM-dependent methyltransferase, partial [Candidatus Binatus sp.]